MRKILALTAVALLSTGCVTNAINSIPYIPYVTPMPAEHPEKGCFQEFDNKSLKNNTEENKAKTNVVCGGAK